MTFSTLPGVGVLTAAELSLAAVAVFIVLEDDMAHSLTCTFCRKSEHEVKKLVAGPGVYICDACIEIAHSIVSETPTPPRAATWRRASTSIGKLWRSVVTKTGGRIDLAMVS